MAAEVGNCIVLGEYEQDGNISNGMEEIEWIVLDKIDNKILVISKYGLDCKPYNASFNFNSVTWEKCSLREWLNNDFFNTAFSVSEKAIISTTTVTAYMNIEYNTLAGNTTQDNIFLLSIAEANKYFNSDEARRCNPTNYVVEKGIWKDDSGNCWWWLRSPGSDQSYAAYINFSGYVDDYGSAVYLDSFAVRPAMWIDFGE